MHRYKPYNAATNQRNPSPTSPLRGQSRSLQDPSGPLQGEHQDGREEEDQPRESEAAPPEAEDEEDGGGGNLQDRRALGRDNSHDPASQSNRKKRGPVSEAVIEHRLALHQVDIGTSGTLAFATTLDHAMRCKT